MEEYPIRREEYIQKDLRAYRQTPGTAGTIRRPDRRLAAQLGENAPTFLRSSGIGAASAHPGLRSLRHCLNRRDGQFFPVEPL